MRKQAIVRRMAGLAVAGHWYWARLRGPAQTGGQYFPDPALKKCLKQAKKKSGAQARTKAKKKCHTKYG